MKTTECRYLMLLLVAFAFNQAISAQSKISDKDLPNFGQVNTNLFRGGQPTEAGIKKLAQMGVKTIVDLRGEDERARTEEAWAQNAGMKFINISLANWFKPQTTDIEQIVKKINQAANQPVFVHCRRGADRTGTVIAVYRILHDDWTAQRAIDEAKNYKIGWWQFWMKDYINDYYRDFKKQTVGK